MSTTTTNYNLVKPELTDAADITAMNPNWDTIDNLLNTLVDEGWLTPVTTANENLNNYVTQGIYSFDSAYAPSNRPTDNSNGWLIVIPWNNTAGVGTVKQIWLRHGTLNSNDHCLYVRTRISSNNAWSSWAQIYTSKDITASLTELNYLSGLSSNVQTQLNALSTTVNGKQASITGAASTITGSNLTASRALISNASGKVGVSSVSATELGYLSGATSNVQNQVDALNTAINGKQATLTFDSSPTNGSTNPVTSGGVYTAVNGKAPTNHAINSTTYGAGSSTNYGHVRLSDSTTSTSSTDGGYAATPAAVKAVKDSIPTVPSAYTSNPEMDGTASAGSSTAWAKGDHIHPTDTSRAPTSHAASSDTYGKGTGSNYGHVKLSDSTSSSTAASSGGTAATPAAVKAVNDRMTYGNSDLTAGTSSLTTGVFYAYYT